MSRWCDEEILLFLELYEQQPCLWNPGFLGYRDNDNRLQAIRWILCKMGLEGRMTEYDVKCKIKNIRTTYMRNLRKLLKWKEKGRGEFTPTLLWFWKADSFLRTDGEVSIYKKEQRKKILKGIDCNPIFADDSEDDPCELDSDQESQGDTGQLQVQPASSLPSATVCPPLKKKRHSVEDEDTDKPPSEEENGLTLDVDSLRIYIRDAQKQLDRLESRKVCVKKEREDTSSRGVENEPNDDKRTEPEFAGATEEEDFDVFARLVGSQLRQLPLERALKCQHEIHSLLMRERIEHVIHQNGSLVGTPGVMPSMVVPNQVTENDTLCFALNCLAD